MLRELCVSTARLVRSLWRAMPSIWGERAVMLVVHIFLYKPEGFSVTPSGLCSVVHLGLASTTLADRCEYPYDGGQIYLSYPYDAGVIYMRLEQATLWYERWHAIVDAEERARRKGEFIADLKAAVEQYKGDIAVLKAKINELYDLTCKSCKRLSTS